MRCLPALRLQVTSTVKFLMQREDLIATIHEFGLSDFENEIVAVSRPCLSITTTLASTPVTAERTKIGCDPDLPLAFVWPLASKEIPMLFLARLGEADMRRIHPHLAGNHLLL